MSRSQTEKWERGTKAGYIENSILIHRGIDEVFAITNDIEKWPSLFTEYESAEVLSRKDNEIVFRLKTYPEDGRPSRLWTSRRVVHPEGHCAEAERLEPLFPFASMNIRWEYESVGQATVMTWIQEFVVDDGHPFSGCEMESFMNWSTQRQMRSIRDKLDQGFGREQ